jgi:hypothetical protein
VPKQGELADLLHVTRMIIWDEAGMIHRYAPEAVNCMLQNIQDDERPFGGITTVFGGDFQQILPVIPRGTREHIVRASLRHSPLWRHTRVYHLTQNMWLLNGADPEVEQFAQWLLQIGQGTNTNPDATVPLPPDMLCNSPSGDVKDLIDEIYPTVQEPLQSPASYFKEQMILSPRNDDVHAINAQVLQRIPGDVHLCQSWDSMEVKSPQHAVQELPVEYLNSINISCLPISCLELKIGAPIMVLRNLDIANGVCNGS